MDTFRIGIDVGGTFTDLALLNEGTGAATHVKVLTTYPNPADGVVRAVDKALDETAVDPTQVTFILHGTTIATNALLEAKGARTALVTTEGFRDVLEIGRQIRPSLFDWRAEKPKPLVPRRRRFELTERVHADGEIAVSPTDADIAAVVDRVLACNPSAVAISLLFSLLRPEHEERLLAAFRARRPQLAISLSSRVLPEYREYERTSTTVANAFITPVLTAYAARLEESLGGRGLNAQLRLLQSNGGIGTVAMLGDRCISTALSGPAGVVTAAAFLAIDRGLGDCISFDMGGTSSDICLIRGGRPEWTVEATIGGFPVRLPMIDVHTVGAGGGSVIWTDSGGGLRVGPQSARSNPGPACYGFGGTEATLTDAHVEVGSLLPEFFAGKDIPFAAEAATRALARAGAAIGLDAREIAVGALQVVNHNLAKQIRAAGLARGLEASAFTLIPFGGAGPLHAFAVAELLGISRVLLPSAAGVLSALGAALADYRYDFSQAFVKRAADTQMADLAQLFSQLQNEGYARLEEFPTRDVRMELSLDLRYVGQSFEINVPAAHNGSLHSVADVLAEFHRRHEAAYGFATPSEPVDIVNVRVSAFGVTVKPKRAVAIANSRAQAPRETPVFVADGTVSSYALVARPDLGKETLVSGPAIVYDLYATALIPPGWSGRVDDAGHILLANERLGSSKRG